MNTFTIGQVADRTGFAPSTLRYYGELGLVTPASRTEAGYRLYDDDALLRLTFISRAKQLGCTLEEITDLLRIWDGEHCGPVQLRFHQLVTDKIRSTQLQIGELAAFGSQLQAAATRLDAMPFDGPCDEGCACMTEVAPTTEPITLVATSTDPPIACTLDASAMPDRFSEWQAVLADVGRRSTTPDGRLRVEFGEAVDLVSLVTLVQAEQQCCAFFSFTVTVDDRGTALEVAAPDEARTLVDAVFGRAS